MNTQMQESVKWADEKHMALINEASGAAQIAGNEKTLKLAEAVILKAISNDTDGNGKPLYSSEDKRKAELIERMQMDEKINALAVETDALRNQLRQWHVDAEYAKDRLAICLAFASSEDRRP